MLLKKADSAWEKASLHGLCFGFCLQVSFLSSFDTGLWPRNISQINPFLSSLCHQCFITARKQTRASMFCQQEKKKYILKPLESIFVKLNKSNRVVDCKGLYLCLYVTHLTPSIRATQGNIVEPVSGDMQKWLQVSKTLMWSNRALALRGPLVLLFAKLENLMLCHKIPSLFPLASHVDNKNICPQFPAISQMSL